jgi:hypothetical protein
VLSRWTAVAISVAIASFACTATALAGPPAATTGAATAVTGTTATLNGIVFANQELTTYYFEYGATTAYGSRTQPGRAAGNSQRNVSASIAGLVPLRTYHFRLVADNPSGPPVAGADMAFTTTNAPAAITIAASRTVLTFGSPVTFSGQVAGSPGEQIALEQSPFPYTDPFKPAAQGSTDAAARYSLTVSPALNTRYHVTANKPARTSADITVRVRTRVGLRLSDRTPNAGQRVRFKGKVLPAHDGSEVRIQRRTSSGWRTIATPTLTAATPLDGVARSKYRKRIRVRRSGAYRTLMPAHDDHARGKSPRRRAVVG